MPIPTARASSFKLQYFPYYVWCSKSFVAKLLNVFLVWLPHFFLKHLVVIPVAPMIAGIIIHFSFHIRCIFVHKLLYLSLFSASFLWHFCQLYNNNIIIIIIKLYSSPNIIRVIKSRRLRAAGNVARVGERTSCVYGFWWGNLKERNHLEDPGLCGRIILRCVFRKWNVGVWNGSRWLRIGTGGGHLWMR